MASKVHRIRYYNPKPESINCVSYNQLSKHIAVARADASIEIWDLTYAPYCIKFIPGVENGSVEALGWINDRLLSTGLGGVLVEWDLDKLNVKNTVLLTGYAAWCLDVNTPTSLVAVGTEQGYVNLYSVDNGDIVYKKIFDKQEGRIMCCKFDKTGKILVTGSVDTIRVWNVETGHATSRMLASRRGKETIVWSLAVLSDNIIVSGDSHGRLTFWDRILGEQIESYTTHKADILSIAVSEDENSLYCSGVDPVITNFIKVNNTGKESTLQWVKNVQRHIHEHDVRALVINDDRLVSVGADGYLTLSSYPPKWVMRMPPMIPVPRSSICAKKKLLLLRYSTYLEVWKLGSYAKNDTGKVVFSNINTKKNNIDQKDTNGHLEQDTAIAIMDRAKNEHTQHKSLKLIDNPVKLISLHSKGQKQIRCCELSPSGEFIVYSTDSAIRMLKLETDDGQGNTSLSKVMINGTSLSCDHITFSEESRFMGLHSAGQIQILQVDAQAGATVIQTISTEKYLKASSILHLHLSSTTPSQTAYLVAADTQGAIAVWTKGKRKYEHYASLPKYKCVPSALTVDNARESLVVTYVDQKIVEYELVNKKFAQWPNTGLPSSWYARRAAVTGVTPHPRRNALIFHDETSLWVLERKQEQQEEPVSKKKFKSGANFGLKIVPIKYLAGFHWVGQDEAVMVEVLPENIVSQLPPVLANK